MKELHYIPKYIGFSYEDMCINPNLDLPEGFKVAKFNVLEEHEIAKYTSGPSVTKSLRLDEMKLY